MCKVLAITNLKNVKVDQKLLNVIKNATTELNDDGFGYAVLDDDGSIHGERTIDVKRFVPLQGETRTKHCPITIKPDNTFGVKGLSPKSLIAHGRFSTNSISLANTHPYVDGNTALIHNGVVSDPSGISKGLLKTNNDTEILLRHWQLGGLESIEMNVSGYYACAIFDKGVLHIMRDSKAPLFMSYVKSIDSYIIATTELMISYICKKMQWKQFDRPQMILDNCYAMFDGNNILDYIMFAPRIEKSSYLDSKASLAFGQRDFDSYDDVPGESYRQWQERQELLDKEALDDDISQKDVYDLIERAEKKRVG